MAKQLNGRTAMVAVIVSCLAILAGGIFTFAVTYADVRHNAAAVEKLDAGQNGIRDTVHEIDKKVERVLTILEEKEKGR